MSKKKRKIEPPEEEHNACVIPAKTVLPLKLWDFLTDRGRNVILEWVKDDKISVRDRARLNQKLERLCQMDFDAAIHTKLLAGPIAKTKHVYKLRIHGDVMLRPLLCRGPINNTAEYTLLAGAVEIGDKLPDAAVNAAAENRNTVIGNPERRCSHVRIPSKS